MGQERGLGRVDHGRGAAHVHVVGGQVGIGREHGIVHQALVTARQGGRLFRQRRCEPEVVVLRGPLRRQFRQVQVRLAARAPEQVERAAVAVGQQVLDHGLERREAGAAAHHDHGALGLVVAHEEGAQRPLDAQDVAFLHLVEHPAGEVAAVDVAHVQFQFVLEPGRAGDGKGAPLAAGQQDVDVLTRKELHALSPGHAQAQARHVPGEQVLFPDAHRQHAHRDVAHRLDLTHL